MVGLDDPDPDLDMYPPSWPQALRFAGLVELMVTSILWLGVTGSCLARLFTTRFAGRETCLLLTKNRTRKAQW